ncbi:UDP-glycosyltransferase 87A2-like protein [Drosera capensis]
MGAFRRAAHTTEEGGRPPLHSLLWTSLLLLPSRLLGGGIHPSNNRINQTDRQAGRQAGRQTGIEDHEPYLLLLFRQKHRRLHHGPPGGDALAGERTHQPMLNLCKLLLLASETPPQLMITFVVTQEWRGFLSSETLPPNIRFVTLPQRGDEQVDCIPGLPATTIGDLPSLFHGVGQKTMHRALEMAAADEMYFQWLDSQPDSSVLYVSMGSFLSVSGAQMEEIVAGIQDSGVR